MSLKKTTYHFTFATFIRVIIFTAVVYFLIVFLASKTTNKIQLSDPTVLGAEDNASNVNQYLNQLGQKAFDSLPPKSQETLTNLPSNPVIIQTQEKLNHLGGISSDLPNKIILEVKKMIVKNIYDNIMKDLESKK